MPANFKTNIPEGFRTLNTYLFTERPQELIDFLTLVFSAEELGRTMDASNEIIRNCVLKIGNSNLMIAQSSGDFVGMRTAIYLYVDNPDEVYQLALANGAQEVFAPKDMDYGDRQGGIMDPAGNYWWISKRLATGAY